MCRGKVKKRGLLEFLDCLEEEFLQITDSDENHGDTDEDDIIEDMAMNQSSEKTNSSAAVTMAFFIVLLFFSEIFLVMFYCFQVLNMNTNELIAHRLCEVFSKLQLTENMTESWCSPSVFNKEFRLEVQCPCFVPQLHHNNTELYD